MDIDAESLARRLDELGVHFVRLCWVDNAGVLRSEAVRANRVPEMADDGLPVVGGNQAIPVHADEVQPDLGIGAIGQVWLRPELDTFAVLPWEPAHARVFGSYVERDGSPWAFCPRRALRDATQRLADRGLSLQGAFEHEFMLLRRAEDGSPLHFENSHYASAHGLDRAGPILDAIAEALEAQAVPVRTMLKEAGLSQFEIATEHAEAMLAADRFVVARETIAAVAARHELIGTSLPLVFGDEAGNGWHLHFSLWQGEENLTGRGDALSPIAQAFLAGIYEHLPALLALTTPTANSFLRKRPGAWTGAYRIWGFDHKEAPLRVPTERHGAPTNIELKASDATANPYLAISGLIAAGLDGIDRKLALPDPVDFDPGQRSEQERKERGIELLPETLCEALDHLESNPVLCDALGPKLARAYLAVKRAEDEHFGRVPLEEQVKELLEAY